MMFPCWCHSDGATKTHGAVVVIHFGSGFGSIVLVESQGRSSQVADLQRIAQLLRRFITTTTIAGGAGWELQTSLVSVALWHQGATAAVATGLVPQALLGRFLAAIH